MLRTLQLIALATLAAFISSSAFAHGFETIERMSNKSAEEASDAADRIHKKNEQTTAVNSYKIVDFEIKKGETKTDAYIRVLKSVLHRDFPITGDDGGYDISASAAKADEKEIASDLGDTPFSESEELVTALAEASKSGLLVLSGTGSGNNTMATIFALVDTKKNELLYLIDSNFGSDD